MTVGEDSAGTNPAPGRGGGGAEINGGTPKIAGKKKNSSSPPVALTPMPSTTTAASTATTAPPAEGAISLRTVGKTVAFLVKLAAPATVGRGGDGAGVFGVAEMGGGGGPGSAHG